MSKETGLSLSSSTVDDISQGVSGVNIICDNGSICGSCSTDIDTSLCANCGKEGATNTCNKCKMVKYCNAVCKKKHKSKHKKDCEEHRRCAAELHEEEMKRAAELHDEQLFKQPPMIDDDCPICFVRLPLLITGKRYQSCCGKVICSGCIHAMDNTICPFCRASTPTADEKTNKQLMKRVEVGDAQAIFGYGGYYWDGDYGLPQDFDKALELYHRAAKLGHAEANYNIGCAYIYGYGVEKDKEKAKHYFELGAIGGDADARHSLGMEELNRGKFEHKKGNTEGVIKNLDRALKHFMIAVEGGHKGSLTNIHKLYSRELATKDVYAEALRSYQDYLGEVRSNQRDEAAKFSEKFKYIE